MSLPARAQPWYSDTDLAHADVSTAARACHSALFGLYALLTGNQAGTNGPEGAPPGGSKWTIDKSSNGTVEGVGDNIGPGFADANFVRAAAGTNHTWWTAHNADGLYVCFDYSTGADQQVNIYLSTSAFSTGGTLTDRPTSANEFPVGGAGGANFAFWDNTAAAGWVSRCTTAGGSVYFFVIKQGTAGGAVLTLQKLDSPCAADATPFVGMFDSTFGGAPLVNGQYCGGRNAPNTSNPTICTMVPSGPIGNFTNAFAGNDADNFMNWAQVPVDYGSGSTHGTKGYLADALWTRQKAGAEMEPTGGPYVRVRLWGMWIPFSVQPSQ